MPTPCNRNQSFRQRAEIDRGTGSHQLPIWISVRGGSRTYCNTGGFCNSSNRIRIDMRYLIDIRYTGGGGESRSSRFKGGTLLIVFLSIEVPNREGLGHI